MTNSIALFYEIEEEKPTGLFIANIPYDANLSASYDNSILAVLKYTFLIDSIDSNDNIYFQIDESTGIIESSQTIDRESKCGNAEKCQITLTVAVTPSAYLQFITVHINIKDVNDNKPYFPNAVFTLSIPENSAIGYKMRLPTAEDMDTDFNGVQNYEIISGAPHFEIRLTNPSNGVHWLYLILLEILDRELSHEYKLKIAAHDNGYPRNSGFLDVIVDVVDSNDNSPKFVNDTYNVTLFENALINSTILKVKAIDKDEGLNAKIEYSILDRDSSTSSLFDIDSNTGIIYLRSTLNYDKRNSYKLFIMAMDGGLPATIPAIVEVDIFIKNSNNGKLRISVNVLSSSKTAEISEKSFAGQFVAHISVSDKEDLKSNDFTCFINDDAFRIDLLEKGQYKISSAQRFDREVQDLYKVQINCSKNGKPPISATKIMTVKVLDANDNVPVFSQSVYYVSVQENTKKNTTICHDISATDADASINGIVEYFLDKSFEKFFQIDKNLGILKVISNLDYEQRKEIKFEIFAKDCGQPSLSATAVVVVSVKDENDCKPTFSKDLYKFKIKENQPAGIEVGKVSALDNDSTEIFDFIEFSLLSSNNSKSFSIDAFSGVIRSELSFDRENIPSYIFEVIASNIHATQILSGKAKVLIEVTDENDNNPILYFPSFDNYTIHVSSRIPGNYYIGHITAYDLDSGYNAKLVYQILHSVSNGIFTVDTYNGAIISTQKLSHFAGQTYKLRVKVLDEGNPSRCSLEQNLEIIIDPTVPFTGHKSHYKETNHLDGNIIFVILLITISILVVTSLIICIVIVSFKSRLKKNAFKAKYNSEDQFTMNSSLYNYDMDEKDKNQIHVSKYTITEFTDNELSVSSVPLKNYLNQPNNKAAFNDNSSQYTRLMITQFNNVPQS